MEQGKDISCVQAVTRPLAQQLRFVSFNMIPIAFEAPSYLSFS
jgi:hypothetical protein